MIAVSFRVRASPPGVACSLAVDEPAADTADAFVGRRASCFGRVAARRAHGAGLVFADVVSPRGEPSCQ
eukprot:159708-Prymnesium_polylepis.1